MSFIDLPFVSGTSKKVKIVPSALRPAKIQNVCPIPIAALIEPNVTVMTNASIQLKLPVMGLAIALYSFE